MNEDMHNLLGRYFSGQVSKEEEAEVLEWKNSSTENAYEFGLLEKIWMGFEDQPAILFDTNRAWQKVDAAIAASAPKKAPVITLSRIAIGIAASLVLALGIWWISTYNDASMQSVVAQADGQQVQLADGSMVFLRKGSSLQYPGKFKKDSRKVILNGEAFFDVEKDPSKPFMIAAEEAEVTVLGTSFSVNTLVEGVSLVVKTGRVKFAAAGDSTVGIVVTAGEKALLKGREISKQANTDANFNAWQTKHLIFTDTPLEEVARTISETYGIQLSIRKEDAAQIAGEIVNIEFRDQTLESVLKELELITTFEIKQRSQSEYEISIK